MPDWNPAEIAGGTADPAFVSDERGVVVGWNEAATGLLGRSADEVIGTRCHEVLCGLDTYGNRYCDRDCAIVKMGERREAARVFVLNVRHATGRRLPVRVSVLRLPADQPSSFWVVHTLISAEVSGRGAESALSRTGTATELAAADAETLTEMEKLRTLTPRETEVLRLLASGKASQDVANELFISLATVRTHVQNILRKLEVHSQLEAVAMAFKRGLI